jgi:hypothetical protein
MKMLKATHGTVPMMKFEVGWLVASIVCFATGHWIWGLVFLVIALV